MKLEPPLHQTSQDRRPRGACDTASVAHGTSIGLSRVAANSSALLEGALQRCAYDSEPVPSDVSSFAERTTRRGLLPEPGWSPGGSTSNPRLSQYSVFIRRFRARERNRDTYLLELRCEEHPCHKDNHVAHAARGAARTRFAREPLEQRRFRPTAAVEATF